MTQPIKNTQRTRLQALLPVTLAVLLGGCAQMPVGPTVTVIPGAYKPFEVFMQDDALCRGWAAHVVGVPGHDEAAQAFIGPTAAGAAVGALAGAMAGGHHSTGGGAAAGTAIGAMIGANQSAGVGWVAQRRYDIAYQQCMYAKGNQIPGVASPAAGDLSAPPRR